MSKYKYYFRQPRSAIAKDVLLWLATAGVITIAISSPYFATNLLRAHKNWKKYPRKKVADVFSRFKKEGLLEIESRNHQIYISLTDDGRKRAGRLQINHLKITPPKKWDRRWRIVIFDIAHTQRVKREALRGLLKRLGFYQLQKSVWIHPFDCASEVNLLKDFFGFTTEELRLITATSLGGDEAARKFFHL